MNNKPHEEVRGVPVIPCAWTRLFRRASSWLATGRRALIQIQILTHGVTASCRPNWPSLEHLTWVRWKRLYTSSVAEFGSVYLSLASVSRLACYVPVCCSGLYCTKLRAKVCRTCKYVLWEAVFAFIRVIKTRMSVNNKLSLTEVARERSVNVCVIKLKTHI